MDYDNNNKKGGKVKEALKRDWEQTKHDFNKKSGQNLNQDAGDTIKQATGSEPVPPRSIPSKE